MDIVLSFAHPTIVVSQSSFEIENLFVPPLQVQLQTVICSLKVSVPLLENFFHFWQKLPVAYSRQMEETCKIIVGLVTDI